MDLPPGQRAVVGFPRYGVSIDRPPPQPPDDVEIRVSGALLRKVVIRPADLEALPHREQTGDFHCVAGWSARGPRWGGVPFATAYAALIEPNLVEWVPVRYVVFVGLDGFRSILTVEDALAEDVLLADRLAGEPLPPEHGAPVRVVAPGHYGYLNTKHLCAIELHQYEPPPLFHRNAGIQRALMMVRPHPRARVWREERHRFLPSRLARAIYRRVVKPPAPLEEGPERAEESAARG